MQPILTTMSFRAAWRFGFPHLAGQTVTLTLEASGYYRVDHASGTVARVAYPQSVRERGGVPRAAEAGYPTKVPRWARDVIAANFAVREYRTRQILSKLQQCRWPPPSSPPPPPQPHVPRGAPPREDADP